MSAIYIGVMTGTSMDGVDIVAASFEPLQLHATLTVPFEPELRDELMALTLPDDNEIDRMGKADVALAKMIGHGINSLIEKHQLDRRQIKAIVAWTNHSSSSRAWFYATNWRSKHYY